MRRVPRVTGDGTFWGGILALIIWGSVVAVFAYAVLQRGAMT